MPTVSVREVLLIWCVFSALAVVMAAGLPLQTDQVGFWNRAVHLVPYYWIWSALSPVVLFATRQMYRASTPVPLQIGAHLALGAALIVVQIAVYVAVVDSLIPQWVVSSHEERVVSALQRHAASNALTYLALAAGMAVVDHYHRTREALAQARLDTLRMQLQPHFLFNALQVASSLMHQDIAAAEEMLERLGDFLRAVLRRDDRHLVPLREELELLEHYLAIMRLRFGERLDVLVSVEPATTQALVPILMLQPLVENAPQHGIGKHAARGRLTVAVARIDNRLQVRVEDNGAGEAAEVEREERIGLTNTRARLQAHFGTDQQLVIAALPAGGVRVDVLIPFVSDDSGVATRRQRAGEQQ